jgi:SAM-dependent methyltransferase
MTTTEGGVAHDAREPGSQKVSPKIMGTEDSHGALRAALARHQPCRVLDAACGQGALAQFLIDRGWDVQCADIFPENFKLKGVSCQKANLNHPLPYENSAFDAIICANAIHRLYNPAGACREFYRVLRPGGRLFLNMNNNAPIDMRLQFLIHGSIDIRDPNIEEGIKPVGDPEGNVRIRVMFPQVAQYLEAAGFVIQRLDPAAVRFRHKLLRPIAWLVWLVGQLFSAKKRRRNYTAYTNSRAILRGGYYVLIQAVKP